MSLQTSEPEHFQAYSQHAYDKPQTPHPTNHQGPSNSIHKDQYPFHRILSQKLRDPKKEQQPQLPILQLHSIQGSTFPKPH